MPSPKDGKAGSPAPPPAPADPAAPIKIDPGQATEAAAKTADAAADAIPAVAAKPFKPMTKQEAKEQGKKLHFIEVKLIDQDKDPVPHEPFKITMPDGSELTGTLNDKGIVRVDGIPDEGNCKVTFPNRDQSTWDKK